MVNIKSVNQVIFHIITYRLLWERNRNYDLLPLLRYLGSLSNAMKSFTELTLADDAATLSLQPRPPVTPLADPTELWRRAPLNLCTQTY